MAGNKDFFEIEIDPIYLDDSQVIHEKLFQKYRNKLPPKSSLLLVSYRNMYCDTSQKSKQYPIQELMGFI